MALAGAGISARNRDVQILTMRPHLQHAKGDSDLVHLVTTAPELASQIVDLHSVDLDVEVLGRHSADQGVADRSADQQRVVAVGADVVHHVGDRGRDLDGVGSDDRAVFALGCRQGLQAILDLRSLVQIAVVAGAVELTSQ